MAELAATNLHVSRARHLQALRPLVLREGKEHYYTCQEKARILPMFDVRNLELAEEFISRHQSVKLERQRQRPYPY